MLETFYQLSLLQNAYVLLILLFVLLVIVESTLNLGLHLTNSSNDCLDEEDFYDENKHSST